MGTMNHGMGGFGGRGGMEFPDFGNRDIADNQVPESVNVSIVLTAVSFVILGIGLLTAFFYKY